MVELLLDYGASVNAPFPNSRYSVGFKDAEADLQDVESVCSVDKTLYSHIALTYGYFKLVIKGGMRNLS